MTHCAGYRAAAVARTEQVRSLGIDAEPDLPLPDGVLATVALPAEIEDLQALACTGSGVAWDRLLFSAKESVYKTWFPLTRRRLGFEEALVRLHPDGTFSASLLVPGPLVDGKEVNGFSGRWAADRQFVLTAVLLPAAGPAGLPQ